ncbi:MAG: UTP--glucose-1-phosphate uridylyltransferase [Planctomycetes bacterium]|nr:UTP--glucose-1-phosphate uridylyltransferase [Planctomycetota bacterium]
MSELKPLLRERILRAGEEQLLEGYEALDAATQSSYAAELDALDWREIAALRALLEAPTAHVEGELLPARAFPLARDAAHESQASRARAAGAEWLRGGCVAALTVAGGQASRLGWDAPKGVFPIGPLSGWSLFEIFARKLRASGVRHSFRPLWYVMTSPQNDGATRAFFEQHGFFGLERERVFFFQQGMLPALSPQGQVLRAAPGKLFLAPTGHGGLLDALRSSGALEHAREHGIERFSYFQVDNPLVVPFDPLFLGLHRLEGARMSSKVVEKRDAAEKVGVLAWQGSQLCVIEYSDLPAQLREARDGAGRLRYSAGSIALHVIERELVEELTGSGHALPWHLARKSMSVVDALGRAIQAQGVKFERFVFDALRFSQKSAVLEVERAREFSPVKNASGEDSPEQARADISRLHARWLAAYGIQAPPALEIDPLFADDEHSLRERLPYSPRLVGGGHFYT